ncbi:sensor domain-containing diguanylate cyclase [Alteromonas facilis]|uniref:GGDEF domain-containing protein n=1 Tax=Alteromonas facilis TaxID=2048004 RepID=UPI000F5C40A9|nr:tetratricopeptide repeat-containing diguanylate cyclase [Alteromonas facilis]
MPFRLLRLTAASCIIISISFGLLVVDVQKAISQEHKPALSDGRLFTSPLTIAQLKKESEDTIVQHLEALQESDQNQPAALLQDIQVIIEYAKASGLEQLELEAVSSSVLVHSLLNNTPEVERLVELYLPRTVNKGSKVALSRLYRALLRVTVVRGQDDKRVAIKRQLGQLVQQGLPARQEGLVYLSLGTSEYFGRNYFAAIQNLRRALDIFVKQELRVDEDRVLALLALLNSRLGNNERAIEIQLKIAERMRLGAKTLNWSIVDFNIARAYFDLQDFESARIYAERSRDVAKELSDNVGVAYANELLADIYIVEQRYVEAINLAEQAIATFEEVGDREKQLDALIRKAKAQVMQKNTIEASKTLELIKPLQAQVNLPEPNIEIAELLSLYFEVQDDYQQALAFYKHFHQQFADIELRERGEALDRMLAEFTNDAQQSEYRYLSQQNALNQAQLNEKEQQQTILYLAILLAVVTAIIIVIILIIQWRRGRLMRDLALTDELTGAPNRRACFRSAKLAFDQAIAGHYSVVIAMVDLDRFKQINDKFGHDVGDEVLKIFAGSVKSVMRERDVFGRLGGEEWLLIFPRSDLMHMDKIFTRLRDTYQAKALDAAIPETQLTFSMGAVSSLDNYSSVQAMITQADKLVYQAKSNGRDRLEINLHTNKA